MDQTPAWEDIIADAMDTRLDSVYTAGPGRIESFDPNTRQATVQPLLRNGYINEEGDRVTEREPALQGVPVLFRGGGGFEETWPVASGDICLLVHTTKSINAWKTGTGGEFDSGDDRKHYIGDAIAIVGNLVAQGKRNTTTEGYTVGQIGGPVIQVTASQVRLGGTDASQAAVGQSALDFFMGALLVAINTGGVAAAALTPLQTALKSIATAPDSGWSAGTSIAKVK